MQEPKILQAEKKRWQRLLADSLLLSYPGPSVTHEPGITNPTPLAITNNFHQFSLTQRPQMKYHYQHVSSTKVRIELIPEDQKEKALIEQLAQNHQQDQPQLQALFTSGIQAYMPGATLTKVNYMNFPKVALCNFNKALKAKTQTVA